MSIRYPSFVIFMLFFLTEFKFSSMDIGWLHCHIVLAQWESWFFEVGNKCSPKRHYWTEWDLSMPCIDFGKRSFIPIICWCLIFQFQLMICSLVFQHKGHWVYFCASCLLFQPSSALNDACFCTVLCSISSVGWKYWWTRICRVVGTWCSKVTSKWLGSDACLPYKYVTVELMGFFAL